MDIREVIVTTINGNSYSPHDLVFNARGKIITDIVLKVKVYFSYRNLTGYTEFLIPNTIKSDGASTPLGIGKARSKLAAYVHDYLTRTKIKHKHISGVINSHKIFKWLLVNHHKYGWIRSNIWYIGVYLFGWMFYTKKTADDSITPTHRSSAPSMSGTSERKDSYD